MREVWRGGEGSLKHGRTPQCGSGTHLKAGADRPPAASTTAPNRPKGNPHPAPIAFVSFKGFCSWWVSERVLERPKALAQGVAQSPTPGQERLPLGASTLSFIPWCGWDGEGSINEGGIRTL